VGTASCPDPSVPPNSTKTYSVTSNTSTAVVSAAIPDPSSPSSTKSNSVPNTTTVVALSTSNHDPPAGENSTNMTYVNNNIISNFILTDADDQISKHLPEMYEIGYRLAQNRISNLTFVCGQKYSRKIRGTSIDHDHIFVQALVVVNQSDDEGPDVSPLNFLFCRMDQILKHTRDSGIAKLFLTLLAAFNL
jgi:hypothetical protein